MNFFQPEPNYGPLNLPSSGDDLQEGRQYYLDEVATSYLKEQGLIVPVIVECISRRYFARTIRTITTNLETGVVTDRTHTDEARPATFRTPAGRGRFHLFSLPIEALHEARKLRVPVDNADHTLHLKNLDTTNKTKITNKEREKEVRKVVKTLDFLLQ